MKSDLEKLVDLQITDSRIRELRNNIETVEERRASMEQEFEEHASSIREVQKQKSEAEDSKKQHENEIAEAKSSLERANRNLTTAQDQKQYEAAMREIDSLNKQVSKHETEILELMETIETSTSTLDERAEEVASLESDWEAKQKGFDKQYKADKSELKKLESERSGVFEKVAPRLASIYNRLITRSRDGIAVAEVVDLTCSACFMKLRKQMIVSLRTTDEILTCESCARILYITKEAETEASA